MSGRLAFAPVASEWRQAAAKAGAVVGCGNGQELMRCSVIRSHTRCFLAMAARWPAARRWHDRCGAQQQTGGDGTDAVKMCRTSRFSDVLSAVVAFERIEGRLRCAALKTQGVREWAERIVPV